MALAEEAKRIAALFEYSKEDVNKGVKEFIREIDEGLQKDGTELAQIPSYVTSVPTGTETGFYLAADLGGTNFRVCAFYLNGEYVKDPQDNTKIWIDPNTGKPTKIRKIDERKRTVRRELQEAQTAPELFSWLATQIKEFLTSLETTSGYKEFVQEEEAAGRELVLKLGFTFSFPVRQTSINQGTLMTWTKGFTIQDAVNKDVCELLQTEIDALKLPVKITIVALVNDTVGAQMARSYESPGESGALIGAIFGTGTNGAYVEKRPKITKLTTENPKPEMIVNTEWGSFDNSLRVLPNTPYDAALDARSVNPGHQMFEKRVSGMFLGEILRLALRELITNPSFSLFKGHNFSPDLFNTVDVVYKPSQDDKRPEERSRLFEQWGLDSKLLSIAVADSTPDLGETRRELTTEYGVNAVSADDAAAVKVIAAAIGKRAARLAAVALGGVILSTESLHPPTGNPDEDIIDIGTDGSLVEHYPNFKGYLREAFREIEGIGAEGDKRIRIEHAEDGSGIGAALVAWSTEPPEVVAARKREAEKRKEAAAKQREPRAE